METKDYEKRVLELKKEIVSDIKEALGTKTFHAFHDRFHIHYIDGDVATTDVCTAVDLKDDGQPFIYYLLGGDGETEEILENLYPLDMSSILDILNRLKKEIREEKLQTLRELVKKAGGEIRFDGKFKYDSYNCEDREDTKVYVGTELMGLSVDENGEIVIHNYWDVRDYNDPEIGIPSYELDSIIEYVRKQTEKSPEERLALTDEQKIVVNQIKNAIAELERLGGAIMLDHDYGRLFVINATGIELNCYGHDSEHDVFVDIAKLPEEDVIGDGYVCYTSEGIYINREE